MEEEPFGHPGSGTPLNIADGESLWCSSVSSGFSVGVTVVTGVNGPGFASTQPTSSTASKQETDSKAEEHVIRSHFIFAAAVRVFLVRIFLKPDLKSPMWLLYASTEQPMLENS